MASLLKKTNLLSQSQINGGAIAISHRGLHVESGIREKAITGKLWHLVTTKYYIDINDRLVVFISSYSTNEAKLLATDPALSRFKSHKKGVKRIKRIGDALTVVVVAGCCCHTSYTI